MTRAPIYYGDYLQLDRLLSLQAPESARHGALVHDEMLSVIVHQVYELWFTQVLHEFDRIERHFSANPVRRNLNIQPTITIRTHLIASFELTTGRGSIAAAESGRGRLTW